MPLEPFMGEIMYVAGGYPPRNWLACDGQLLGINQYQALFSLLGTTYGGNGVQTFGLPDLRGRAIMGGQQGSNPPIGAIIGAETVALQVTQMPSHTHSLSVTATAGTTPIPSSGAALGTSSGQDSDGGSFPVSLYNGTLASPAAASPAMIANNGASQGHENRQPFNVLMACIAIQGIFPSRS